MENDSDRKRKTKAGVHPVMAAIYHVLRFIVRMSLRAFYSAIEIVDRERLDFDNPCIVVSNHPSTLMDPLNTAAHVRRKIVFFLAKASLFHTPFRNWFFNTFYCIPVERYQDTNGRPPHNEEAFRRSADHLLAGGCLYIAPEGTSWPERRLHPVKTGTARIAFQTMQRSGWRLPLTILPVGLNYSDPRKGRATLVLHVGKPIVVREFKEEYEADPFEAVKELTEKIRQRLSSLILDTADDDEDLLLRRLEILHQNEHQPSPAGHHFWAQAMLDELRALSRRDPESFAVLKQKVAQYFHLLAEHGLWDIGVRLRRRRKRDLAFVLTGAPLWLFGKVNNFIPAHLPGWVNARFNDDPAYDSTWKYLTGLLAFPLFYGLQTFLVHWLFWYPTATALYLASLWPSAVYMWNWEKRFEMLKHAHRFRRLWKRDYDAATTLLELRAELLDRIEEMGLG